MSWWVLQNIGIAFLLAIIAETASRTLAHRVSPSTRHALWLIVIVKLVTPPILVLTLPWTPESEDLRSRPLYSKVTTYALSPPAAAFAETHERSASALAPAANVEDRLPTRDHGLSWLAVGATIWLVGGILVLGLQVSRIWRMRQWVDAATAADPELAADVAEIAVRLGVGRIAVRIVRDLDSPVIWSLNPLRAELLWPAILPEIPHDTHLAFIVHELAHVRRRDHWVGWLELAASVVWWWNPVFWLARRRLREYSELACDAWVVNELPHARRSYADGLLSLSAGRIAERAPIPATGIRSTSARALERRLAMIVRPGTPPRVSRVGAVALGLITVASTPLWASPQRIVPSRSSPAVIAIADVMAVPPPAAMLGNDLARTSTGKPLHGTREVTPTAHAGAETIGDTRPFTAVGVQVAPQGVVDLTLDDAVRASDAPESDVRQAYWELVYAIENVDSARQSLALTETLVRDSAIKVTIGTLAPLELTSARAEEAQRQQAMVLAENRRLSAQTKLVQLLRRQGNERLLQGTLNPVDRGDPQPLPVDVEASIRAALQSGAEVKEMRERLKQLELQTATNVTNSANRVQNAQRALEAVRRRRAELSARLLAAERQFNSGTVTQDQLIVLQRFLVDVQQEELRARLNYREAQAEFERVQRNPTSR